MSADVSELRALLDEWTSRDDTEGWQYNPTTGRITADIKGGWDEMSIAVVSDFMLHISALDQEASGRAHPDVRIGKLIVAAVNALPDLLDRLERAEAERDEAQMKYADCLRVLNLAASRAEQMQARLAKVEALADSYERMTTLDGATTAADIRARAALVTEAGERDE